MMKYYLLKLEYYGPSFYGSQNQKNESWPTIQSEMIQALIKLHPQMSSEDCKIQAVSRTDRGVHALSQWFQVQVRSTFPSDKVKQALNYHLPETIRIAQIQESPIKINLMKNALWKEYRYFFYLSSSAHPVFLNHMVHYPYFLDLSMMHLACEKFIGKHDFKTFQCAGTQLKTTIRTIYHVQLIPFGLNQAQLFPFPENSYLLQVIGSGFLKQMIRLMMGAIWEIGRGRKTLKDLELALKGEKNDRLAAVAPAQGLYLYDIGFRDQNNDQKNRDWANNVLPKL